MRIFDKLLCCHDYEVVRDIRVFENETDTRSIYRKILLVCKKCGKIKKMKM